MTRNAFFSNKVVTISTVLVGIGALALVTVATINHGGQKTVNDATPTSSLEPTTPATSPTDSVVAPVASDTNTGTPTPDPTPVPTTTTPTSPSPTPSLTPPTPKPLRNVGPVDYNDTSNTGQ